MKDRTVERMGEALYCCVIATRYTMYSGFLFCLIIQGGMKNEER